MQVTADFRKTKIILVKAAHCTACLNEPLQALIGFKNTNDRNLSLTNPEEVFALTEKGRRKGKEKSRALDGDSEAPSIKKLHVQVLINKIIDVTYIEDASFYPIIVIKSISFYKGSVLSHFIMKIQGHR